VGAPALTPVQVAPPRGLHAQGAAFFALWTAKPHRSMRDLDLLGFGDPGEGRVREVTP
jgi:hypothetical protein